MIWAAAAVAVGALSMSASADLTPYSQDFEGMEVAVDGSTVLGDDGWLVFANVYGPDWSWWYNYGPFPAPNNASTPAFSNVVTGQGGPDQGDRQLVAFSDYQNSNHGDGSNAIIESNVYQEFFAGAADVGSTWTFEFDGKLGDLTSPSTAQAFIKAFDTSWNIVDFPTLDTHTLPTTWGTYSLDVTITSAMVGGAVQIGFLNFASNYDPSGVVYDNVSFVPEPATLALLGLGGLVALRRRR
jgi:hypothetical protein